MSRKIHKIKGWELIIIISIGSIIFFFYQFPALFNHTIISDDVRVHYYPIYKLKDSSLFQDDIITDIFIFETPKLFLYIIYLLSYILDIIILSKVISFLVFLSIAYFAYKVGTLYLSKPGRVLFLIIFLIQIWSYPAISGGLPRSFSYLFVLGFIYYQSTSQHIKKSIILILALLLYTPALFITWLAYAFLKLQDLMMLVKKKKFTKDLKLFLLMTAVLLVSGYFLYSDAHENRFGKIADYKEVSTNIVFTENGRVNLYPVKPYYELVYDYTRPLILINLLLLIPFIYINKKKSFHLSNEIWLILLSGIILHYVAGYTGIQLHWYTRFARYTFPLVLVLFFSKNIEMLMLRLKRRFRLSFILIILILTGSFMVTGTTRNLMVCDKIDVYSFLSTTNEDSLTAGHTRETPCIPLYSKRKVFTSNEAIDPAYSDYYEEIKKRTMDFYTAFYSENISEVRRFCVNNNVDFLLVDYIYLTNIDFNNNFLYEPFITYILDITENKSEYALMNIDDEKKIINNDKYFLIRCGDI